MAKRRRLPNGMGSITKLGKSRGKKRLSPYMARLPAQYDINGKEVHKEYSKATIRQLKTVMVKIYDHAIEKHILDQNIAEQLKVRGTAEKGDEGKNPFTDEELIIMYNKMDQIPFLKHILIMSLTGLRTSEYRNLKVESIDLDNNIIEDFGIKTDTGKQRTVYILETIRPIIAELMKESKSGYLYEKYGKHMSDTTFRKDFQEAIEEAGLSDHVPYDCRRSLATRAKKHQARLRNVSDMLGHKDEKTTEKYYIIDDEIQIDEKEMSKLELVI